MSCIVVLPHGALVLGVDSSRNLKTAKVFWRYNGQKIIQNQTHNESKGFLAVFTHVSLCVSVQVCFEHSMYAHCDITSYNTHKHCLTHLNSDSRFLFLFTMNLSILLDMSFLLLQKFDALITENTPNKTFLIFFPLSFSEFNCQISIFVLLQIHLSMQICFCL